MQRQQVILGIDHGSTSTRAFLFCPGSRLEICVENTERNNHNSRYEKGDFSSNGYPFDSKEPVYLGEHPDPDRQSISLKYAFYPLSNASQDLLKQYPLVGPLLERKDDPHFLNRLRQGLKELFSTLHRRIEGICNARRISITTIGLSVPAQWTYEFADAYGDIISEVFNQPKSDISFYSEAVSLVHHLFRNHMGELGLSGDSDIVLLLDFGGHNMNGCIYAVVNGEEGTRSFHLISDVFGTGGGSELWEHNIGEESARVVQKTYRQRLSASSRQDILDQFNRQKPALGLDSEKSMPIFWNELGTVWSINLASEKILECFNKALCGPLQLAAERIAELAKFRHVNPRVIVSGGTSRNHTLRSRLRQLCADARLPEPVFTDTLSVSNDTFKIARGVAYATGNVVTKEAFFQRGAAFGLQMRQHPKKGNGNPEGLWDDTAKFLLDINRQKTQKVWVNGLDELKIVCDPFCCAPPDLEELHFYKTYDFLHLGKITQGHWLFRLSIHGGGNSIALLLQKWRKPLQGKRFGHVESRLYPLCFDRGSNCLHVANKDGSIGGLEVDMSQGSPGSPIAPNTPDCAAADPMPDILTNGKPAKQIAQLETHHDPSMEVVHASGHAYGDGEASAADTSASAHSMPPPQKPQRIKPTSSLLKTPRANHKRIKYHYRT